VDPVNKSYAIKRGSGKKREGEKSETLRSLPFHLHSFEEWFRKRSSSSLSLSRRSDQGKF
jgi:hypothetical protein